MKQVEERYISFEASKMAYRDIKNSVDTAKREGIAEGKEIGMKEGMEKGMKQGREEGRAEGMNLRSLEIARKMLAKGMDEASIMDMTGLTAEEIKLLSGMGTTVVAATCADRQLQVANVGDSRLYIADDVGIRQITEDHSLVQEMVRFGGISREQARIHPDRNIITRAVGVEDDLQVDLFLVPLEGKDRVLLCSDGLTGMLEDEEILQILEGEGNVEERAQRLVQAANDHGGRDNIAVIIMEPFSDEVSG